MKVVILAGGFGTRLTEETESKPKPMVEVGGHPILWHILKHYAHHDHREFFIALGYKGTVIKKFFRDYYSLQGDMTVGLKNGEVEHHERDSDDWKVHLIDTGVDVMTGGRVKRLQKHIGNEPFMLTYGDGVCDVDLTELVRFHKSHGRIATVTAVRPPARFGGLVFEGDIVKEFTEKPQIGEGWINGGFMVFEPRVFDYLEGDRSILEADALERLAADGQLAAFRHDRFWQCMDTLRDLRTLEALWQSGNPPWRIWET
jgi:glucose-1-phosphate cytidylyltransferase